MAKEPLKVSCSIEADESWRQTSCHWDCERFFKLTWEISTGDLYNYLSKSIASGASLEKADFYYRIGKYVAVPEGETVSNYYTQVFTDDIKSRQVTYAPTEATTNTHCTREKKLYTYFLKLTDLDYYNLPNKVTDESYLFITAYIKAKDTDGKFYTNYFTFDYYLQLPPKHPITGMKSEQIVDNPGELLLSCNKAEAMVDLESSKVEGYCLELSWRKDGEVDFSPIAGLTWQAAGLQSTPKKYKLIQDTNSTATEIYLDDPDTTQVYFDPKDCGITSGEYRFTIFPYIRRIGGTTYLSNQGTVAASEGISKGIVRVKTDKGWIDGQVWVKTVSGWRAAEYVYVKTADGWREAT